MPTQPITLARQTCDTMMRRFAAADLPPAGHFHYHQGVFLSGVYKTYELTGEEKYFHYMKDWVDSVFTEDGKIKNGYMHGDLDDIQPGILLYPLLDRTGDGYYRRCIESVAAQIPDIPLCRCGTFSHKVRFTGQIWLDSLYMLGPFMSEYGRRFDRPDYLAQTVQHVLLMREHTRDKKTGLWKHGWDEKRQAPWCDPDTGLAPEFWGRSLGWVPVAILDDLEQLSPDLPGYEELRAIVPELLGAVCKYQGPDGRWWQVVDKVGAPENWPENSCTCLFAAAIAKGVRKGVLGKEWLPIAKKAYEGVAASLTWEDGDIQIGSVCIGTGIGDYAFYCARPCSTNDLHGVGAFLLMCTELQQVWEEENNV